jgi:hypothetical protein
MDQVCRPGAKLLGHLVSTDQKQLSGRLTMVQMAAHLQYGHGRSLQASLSLLGLTTFPPHHLRPSTFRRSRQVRLRATTRRTRNKMVAPLGLPTRLAHHNILHRTPRVSSAQLRPRDSLDRQSSTHQRRRVRQSCTTSTALIPHSRRAPLSDRPFLQ